MQNTLEKEKSLIEYKCNEQKNNRVIYFDILNILACLCVVFIHMNGIVNQYNQIPEWKSALVIEVICYWAVPVFVMLSGATLMKYRERYNTEKFFKKRFVKILIPWIIWSLIMYFTKNRYGNIRGFIHDFMACGIEGVYWFCPLILYLYCLIPVLSIFTEKAEHRKILKGITIFVFVFSGVLKPIYVIIDKPFPAIFNYFIGPNAYIMFLILGYLISNAEIPKKKRIIIYILGIASAVIRCWYTYYFSTKQGHLNRDLFDYTSAVSVLLAMSVFVFIKNINWEKIIAKLHISAETIAEISGCSFGIYLIHMLVKYRLTDIFKFDVYDIWYRTVGAILLYILCFIIVYTIKKIPILRKIVP